MIRILSVELVHKPIEPVPAVHNVTSFASVNVLIFAALPTPWEELPKYIWPLPPVVVLMLIIGVAETISNIDPGLFVPMPTLPFALSKVISTLGVALLLYALMYNLLSRLPIYAIS